MNFADRVIDAVMEKKSHVVVGLDPMIDRLPSVILQDSERLHGKNSTGAAHAIFQFNKLIIDAVWQKVPAIKPQLAYYEVFGAQGLDAFWKTVEYAHSKKLLVIADAKRGDIDSTAAAYASAYLGGKVSSWIDDRPYVDSMTVNPFLGSDSIMPFVKSCVETQNGLFVLVKTSNPSSGEIQDQVLDSGGTLSEHIANLVNEWGSSCVGRRGYSSVGAVVGAPYPGVMENLRSQMPHSIFLVPGFGTQGGSSADVAHAFNDDGLGALISASRSIIYAWDAGCDNLDDVTQGITDAVDKMNKEIHATLQQYSKCAW